MAREQSRGRDTPLERPVRLCRDDRKKLYRLLDADLDTRVRRIEFAIIALLAMNGVNLASLASGGPNVPAAAFHAARGLFA